MKALCRTLLVIPRSQSWIVSLMNFSVWGLGRWTSALRSGIALGNWESRPRSSLVSCRVFCYIPWVRYHFKIRNILTRDWSIVLNGDSRVTESFGRDIEDWDGAAIAMRRYCGLRMWYDKPETSVQQCFLYLAGWELDGHSVPNDS